MCKEYRIKVSVRNNLILKAIEDRGYKSVSEFCRLSDIDQSAVGSFVSFRKKPINKDGELIPSARLLANTLGVEPYDLWTEEQLYLCLDRNTAERSANAVDLASLSHVIGHETLEIETPEAIVARREGNAQIAKIVDTLTAREARIVRLRFGIGRRDAMTLEQVGMVEGVTPERIRTIETKAIKKLKNSDRATMLQDA